MLLLAFDTATPAVTVARYDGARLATGAPGCGAGPVRLRRPDARLPAPPNRVRAA